MRDDYLFNFVATIECIGSYCIKITVIIKCYRCNLVTTCKCIREHLYTIGDHDVGDGTSSNIQRFLRRSICRVRRCITKLNSAPALKVTKILYLGNSGTSGECIRTYCLYTRGNSYRLQCSPAIECILSDLLCAIGYNNAFYKLAANVNSATIRSKRIFNKVY